MDDALSYVLQRFNITHISEHTRPVEIPGATRNDLAVLFAELGYKVGAEIGTWRGEFAEVLCKANSGLLLNCIDPYQAIAYADSVSGWPKEQERFTLYYKEAREKLKPYSVNWVKAYSMTAVKRFDDNSLDFVYIDANHNFQHVVNDLCEWLKKVKPGGIISGHDYARFKLRTDCHVKAVLNAYTDAFGITPWFLLGAMDKDADPGRDLYRSWFWVKK